MVVSRHEPFLAAEDYLASEEISSIKHEYVNGFTYAMAGASDAHVTIAGNLFALLRNHLRGTGCRVFIADMKVRIESLNIYYYPDLLVTCDERDRALSTFKRYPNVIIEVLSEATEAFDRGDKFADYQQLESLQEYVLISQKRRRVECYRHQPEGFWTLHSYHLGDRLPLNSIHFQVAVADLYEDVDLTTIEPPSAV